MKKIVSFLFLLLIYPVLLNAQSQHFTFTANTGDSYSIVVDSALFHGSMLQSGDEIGVFTPAGLCVGAVIWTGTIPIGITAWADDPQTQATDGYVAGEAMVFKIWISDTGMEYEAVPGYKKGNGNFGDGAYCVVSLSVIEQTQKGIMVTNTNDTGEGSLRWALEQANSKAGPDTIVFNIPDTDANFDTTTGVWTIYPQSGFPVITDSNLVIDGLSQQVFIEEDTNPEGPEIQIDGSHAGNNSEGFFIRAPGVEILGLIINNFQGNGIMVTDIETGEISGCYIGVSSDGLEPASNSGVGIYLNWPRKFHVSSLDTMPTIISGNGSYGIYMVGCSNNVISGSIIGLNRMKTDTLGNAFDGIYIMDSDSNEVVNNAIGGNRMSNGIRISKGKHNTISHNSIGCNPNAPEMNLGNAGCGIAITSSDNLIGENTIAYNKVYGVSIYGEQAIRNKMTRNLIFRNGWAGIKNNNGGNNELPAPVLTDATSSSVTGTTLPNAVVEMFADEDNQGAVFLGTVTADTAGNFNWTGEGFPPEFFFTATATDSEGNTSEFANAMKVATAVDKTGSPNTPDHFSLSQNYPNPFNPHTRIHFEIRSSGKPTVWVKLCIYNLQGELIRTLINEEKPPGNYRADWDGLDGEGHVVAAGTYLYRITAGKFKATKKMILLK